LSRLVRFLCSGLPPVARAEQFDAAGLAIPLLAGPSAMATVLLLASRQPERTLDYLWERYSAHMRFSVSLTKQGKDLR